MTIERLAFDRASVRELDSVGRLQVKVSNISKANVCGYYGREIPNSNSLGLIPSKLYMLYRDPEELKKAANTFNHIPIHQTIHTPDFPNDPPRVNRVGVTHSSCAFDGLYLTNGLSIWDNSAIAGIESEEQKELSSAYQYVADMTPGTTNDGVYFDGVMRDIVGNHVALVENGRAGNDVVVGDSLPLELQTMSKRKEAAIRLALTPVLAQDADINAAVRKAMLALDEAEKEDEKEKVEEEAKNKVAKDEETEEEKKDREAKEKIAADEEDAANKKEEDGKDESNKTAMDSAIKKASEAAEKRAVDKFNAIRRAEADVKPLVGDVIAMDSADDIYRFAMDSLQIEHKGVHPSAFPSLISMAKSQKEMRPSYPRLAMDSSAEKSWDETFPSATKLKRS